MSLAPSPNHSINTENYVHRMAHVSDKLDLARMISPGATVLDYGCADGSFLTYLNEAHAGTPAPTSWPTSDYVGYDPSFEMITRARAAHPDALVTNDLTHLDEATFDVIVLSSVLHEVFSYSTSDDRTSDVIDLLADLKKYLAPGGHILVREGFIPDHREFTYKGEPFLIRDELSIDVIDADEITDALYVIKHANQCEHVTLHTLTDQATLSGPLDEMLTFFSIMTWGWASMQREKNERVNFATHAEWEEIFAAAGLDLVSTTTLTQAEYIEHLTRFLYLDEDIAWPTKAIFDVTALPS